jgi:hypothetical protein
MTSPEIQEPILRHADRIHATLGSYLESGLMIACTPETTFVEEQDKLVLELEAYIYDCEASDPASIIELQKSVHDVISGWHTAGKIDDQLYSQYALEIFSDFGVFANRLARTDNDAFVANGSMNAPGMFTSTEDDSLKATNETLDLMFERFLHGDEITTQDLVRLEAGKCFSAISFMNILEQLKDDLPTSTEQYAPEAIALFASAADAEFSEPSTPEHEMTSAATLMEHRISEFIDTGTSSPNPVIIDQRSLDQISEIYNPNNLLALAKEYLEMSPESIIGQSEVYSILRYFTVLRMINNQYDVFALQEREADLSNDYDRNFSRRKRTWAGYVHEFGFDEDRLDPHEFKAFSPDHDEPDSDTARVLEQWRGTVHIDGVPVAVHRIVGAIIGNDR